MSVSDYSGEGSVLDRENSFIGKSVPRANAARLVAGQGKYVDDLTLPRMVHVVYYRSPYAHARIRSIDLTAARAMPGVVDAFGAADITMELPLIPLRLAPFRGFERFLQQPIARDKVR